LAVPAPAGEVVPYGDDFFVYGFEFGATSAALAMSPDGSVAVAWDEFFFTKGARGHEGDGTPVGSIWDINDGGAPPAPDSLDVTALGDNDFVIAWKDYNAVFEPVIHARRFALDGMPLAASVEVINGADGSTNITPVVDAWPIFDAFLVAWAQEDPGAPGEDGLEIRIDAFAVAASAGEGLFPVNTFTAGDQDLPALSVGADSSFVVAWRSDGSPGDDVDGRSVQARWFSPGGSPESQFQVNTVTTGDQERPDVAVAPDGRFLVVWDGLSTGSDPDRSIQGRMYDPDRLPLGPDFQINTTTADTQSQPTVEARADSSFLVVWRSPAGVQAQVVDADGNLDGLELRLNSTETEIYVRPTLAGSLNGRFVVTWDTEDHYEYGEYRRARLLRDAIFTDGFESGDTSAWSATVP
jgi:hypothetical protein